MSNFDHRLFEDLKALRIDVRPEQWFCFEDRNGIGYAEADLLVVAQDIKLALVFECKRTHTDRGLVQLGQLYMPLVRHILKDFKVFGLLVCQNLDPNMNRRYLLHQLGDWFDIIEKGIVSGTSDRVPLHSLCWRS